MEEIAGLKLRKEETNRKRDGKRGRDEKTGGTRR
jgi:hypothetical protein